MQGPSQQGPSQQQPGRRAGDMNGTPGMPGGNLKDWQKNTWYGPAPTNSNPFEEPEDAPELLQLRSSNVSDRSGDFWEDQQTSGYKFASEKKQPKGGRKYRARRTQERMVSLRVVLIFAAMVIITVLVLFFGVFRIREIRVIGCEAISASDIRRFSGIRPGDSILTLSEEETERRMNAAAVRAVAETGDYNYYRLQFRYIEKELPGTVTIAVREREACCWLTWSGILYVLDKNGMVLFETEDLDMHNQMDLVEVKGLTIRSGAQVGQTVVLSSAAQEQVFRNLFMEMKVTGCTKIIREADLSNTSSILLTTVDPFTVSLGGSESIHAKLRSLTIVREKLLEMGKDGGSINVSNPESPFYSPSSPN